MKSDAWLLEPNGEKSRLLPTAPAAHHLPGRWVSGTGGRHHLRSGSADLCLSPPGLPACPPQLPSPSQRRHAIPPNHIKPALHVAASCQERSSQGPRYRKQETAAFLSSDEEHRHMAAPPPPASPHGARPLIPQSLGCVHMVGWGCFQFPFPGGWKIPAVWAQIEGWQAFPTRAGCSQPTSQPASFSLPLPLLPLSASSPHRSTSGGQFG